MRSLNNPQRLQCTRPPRPSHAEQELHRCEAAHEQLERRLEAQEIQPADVERMARRKAQLREDAAKAHAEARATADRALTMGQDVKVALERLRAATLEYNSAATRLQVAPAGAKYSQGQDFLLRVNDAFLASIAAAAAGKGGVEGAAAGAATSAALLSTDVKGVVKFGLREMKAKLARTVADAGRAGLEVDSDLANLAEARAEATKKIDAVRRGERERLRRRQSERVTSYPSLRARSSPGACTSARTQSARTAAKWSRGFTRLTAKSATSPIASPHSGRYVGGRSRGPFALRPITCSFHAMSASGAHRCASRGPGAWTRRASRPRAPDLDADRGAAEPARALPAVCQCCAHGRRAPQEPH